MEDSEAICFLCQAEDSETNQVIEIFSKIYLCEECFNKVLQSVEEGTDEYDHFFDLTG
jgi:hypothetical protein